MTLANRLVGNPDHAGALEMAGVGPTLRVRGSGHLAVAGCSTQAASWKIDGRDVPPDTVVEVAGGQVIQVGSPRAGSRVYLAVGGGLEPEGVFGSVSSDLLSGFHPGPLQAGDVLPVGTALRPRGFLNHLPADKPTGRLRVIAGPHCPSGRALEELCNRRWTVGSAASRVGLHLESGGPALEGGEIASLGMVTGAVQIPPGGEPMLLGIDHGTVGGYPVAACVIDADLDDMGQLAPGDPVEFTAVGLDEARKAALRRARDLDAAVAGWFPTVAGG
jgi:biotin-dependent carboxylase-like uncharacterized protein